MRESDFRDLELKLRLDSDSAGVSRIDFEDGLVLYSVLFTHLSGASGVKVLIRAGWRFAVVPTLEGVLIARKP
ncbi:MAG: hypothetical protein RXO54_03120 [Acidilobus sp.]